jgi:signal transduction histidine kinase
VPWLFYLNLFGLTAGTLVYLFLIVLILGHRRPRLFERLLFFLVLSMFLIYSGELLEINAQIQYVAISNSTRLVYQALITLGTLFLLPLIWHTHVEYRHTIAGRMVGRSTWAFVCLSYLATLYQLADAFLESRKTGASFLETVSTQGLTLFTVWAACSISAAALQLGLARKEKDQSIKQLGYSLFLVSVYLSIVLILRWSYLDITRAHENEFRAALIIGAVLPGVLLIYWALRHNFLEYGRQRNLIYALSASSLALLYLALVRRISGVLEPVLPPEATAAILLFALIFLFEPLQRVIGPVLHRRMSERMGRVQRLTVELQQEARQGNVVQLIAFAEQRIRGEFGLAAVRISVPRGAGEKPLESPGGLGHTLQVPLKKDGHEIGLLEAASTGSYLTGETSAALEFIGEQLPAMVDLCGLIEEKVRLERELAERERLAVLGQMAASVSHNLRNPLSSMKTILQVQLEHPNLPLDVRHDCALVVDEIDRMGEKLKQLLSFAKPSVNGQSVAAVALARQTAALFVRDAERRNLRLEFDGPTEEIFALASEDAIGEVLSNLIVNAIEAQPNGGRVRVGLSRADGRIEIRVDDDGPGISAELRAKIFQPYFTTKATGTGLGLSIVARRVEEIGGTISCESPVRDGKGTRFVLVLSAGEPPLGYARPGTQSGG